MQHFILLRFIRKLLSGAAIPDNMGIVLGVVVSGDSSYEIND
jgi:hypothetical protein